MTVLKNPEKLKFIIQDMNDNDHEISVRSLGRKTLKEFNDEMEKIKGVDPYETIVKQLMFFSGKEEKFFDDFDIRVLTNAVAFITKEIQRPFAQQETNSE